MGIGRVVASQADTAGPHSPVSVTSISHCHWLTEVTTPPLFPLYFLIKITQAKQQQQKLQPGKLSLKFQYDLMMD